MNETTVREQTSEPSSPLPLLAWMFVLALQGGLVWIYVSIREPQLGLFHLYPFIWINLGLWVVWKTSPVSRTVRHHGIAGAVAIGYFLILGYFGGLFHTGHDHHEHHADFVYGLEFVLTVPPGYGPAILYAGPNLTLAILPYVVIGYVALAYLLYVTVLDVSGSAVSGVLGVFTCVGCSCPILASILTGVGVSGTVTTAIYAQSGPISTIAFVLTALLLYWRPFNR